MHIRYEVQAIIFDKVDDNVFVLLVRKLDSKRFLPAWRLLKGGIEKGETKEEALKREIKEEVGLENIQIIKKCSGYQYTFQKTLHKISSYLVKADMKEKVDIDSKELIGYAWMKLEEAKKLLAFKEEKEVLTCLEDYLSK